MYSGKERTKTVFPFQYSTVLLTTLRGSILCDGGWCPGVVVRSLHDMHDIKQILI
jgi:hypothetical protein